MAFRGRGGFRFNHKPDKQEPFILFPEDVALPDKKCVALDEHYFSWNNRLESYFENSAYFVEDSASRDTQHCDIEGYIDPSKPKNKMKRGALSDYMKLEPGYFPSELVQGVKARPQKKVKWNNEEESQNLQSLFTKIGKKNNEKRENNKEEKEEGDEEDDEEKEEDYSSGGDYEQNEDFDDDEDDFNANDDGDDEPFF